MRTKIYIKPPVISFTKEGYAQKEKEHAALKASRPAAVEDLQKARAMGDLSENGYYKAAKAKLVSIDRELRHLGYLLRYGKIIHATSTDIVMIDTQVTISSQEKTETYHVVGEQEADPSSKKISILSPLGIALLGKKVGEKVQVSTPSKTILYLIEHIA